MPKQPPAPIVSKRSNVPTYPANSIQGQAYSQGGPRAQKPTQPSQGQSYQNIAEYNRSIHANSATMEIPVPQVISQNQYQQQANNYYQSQQQQPQQQNNYGMRQQRPSYNMNPITQQPQQPRPPNQQQIQQPRMATPHLNTLQHVPSNNGSQSNASNNNQYSNRLPSLPTQHPTRQIQVQNQNQPIKINQGSSANNDMNSWRNQYNKNVSQGNQSSNNQTQNSYGGGNYGYNNGQNQNTWASQNMNQGQNMNANVNANANTNATGGYQQYWTVLGLQ